MIELRNIKKTFFFGESIVPALKGISLTFNAGDFIAITGSSGSGKSTLMNVIGLLDGFDSGYYSYFGQDVSHITEDEAADFRNRQIGFVFQSFNLVPRLTAQRNVELPMIYAGISTKKRLQRASAALHAVGLAHRLNHTPAQLSGGQQQRVAIARALVNNPHIIIADEPTGSLDSNTTKEIMELFTRLHALGKTIIIVTHEENVAQYAHRIVRLYDGLIEFDSSQ